MAKITLFPKDQSVGIFRGFSEGGLEFHADIVLPYHNNYQNIPMHGQFLLVQLSSDDEAVLGRITSFRSDGRLTSGAGEDFSLRAMGDDRDIPEDILENYVKYRVNIRVLGVIRQARNETGHETLVFVPSHRRLPHVGAKVAFPSSDVLREIAGHNIDGADLGFFALGEFIYSGEDKRIQKERWMQIKSPEVVVHFPIANLVARRSFVFARAGFGKSNLVKLLFSALYRKQTPTIKKRWGNAPVGTIIFDPDGEYFWPDVSGRPGLADVKDLRDRLVVFTRREPPSDYYGSFVAGSVKLDIRWFSPTNVVSISLSPERQDQQNVRKLRGMSQQNWISLVDLVHVNRSNLNAIDTSTVANLIGVRANDDSVEALAAKANMAYIVNTLHDPNSTLMESLLRALSEGKLCVVDISQMRGEQGLILSGLILQQIFQHNQENFTTREGRTIPTIAVVEEAQSVLNSGSGSGPYVSWFKEGRKYDLGAVMITQQPGSIPSELLSQGDNWFIFHLLSASDLISLQRANAHFSNDLLGSLLNEPLPGQGVMWSSVGGTPYPVAFRALSFELLESTQDPNYDLEAPQTYALTLRLENSPLKGSDSGVSSNTTQNVMENATKAILEHPDYKSQMIGRGAMPWFVLVNIAKEFLPTTAPVTLAHSCIQEALNSTFGENGWSKQGRTSQQGKEVLWAIKLKD
jgi:hypothetical protein